MLRVLNKISLLLATLCSAFVAYAPISIHAADGEAVKKEEVRKETGGTEEEREQAFLKSLKPAEHIDIKVFAGEKQIANPTAIAFDFQNRLYVAETLRFRSGGGLDIRSHLFLYADDIKSTTTDDRRALYEKYKAKYAPDYFTKYSEEVKVLEDAGSGRADKVGVFATNMNDALDGPAVGISYRDGHVQLANIPKIYDMPVKIGPDGLPVAEKNGVMFDGFGVRVGISGHDLHGLIWGPDGKLYFSMGDRGFKVKTKEGTTLEMPGSGGVFRCNQDGSGLELYYHNLRNPEELAFDQWGNLFTCDNNADIGDAARLVYILEGGDTGWNSGWQLLSNKEFSKHAGLEVPQPNPWLKEGLWKLRFEDQPQWITPPVGLITNGPCGLAYYPGTGLSDKYNESFFVADYTAGTNSGVYDFKTEEDGAGFKLKDPHKFIWGFCCTDVAFGYDGRMFYGDYIGGWHEAYRAKGRILASTDSEAQKAPIAEVKKIFLDGFSKRPVAELSAFLSHIDMRVRTEAQWELAKRGETKTLVAAATSGNSLLARVHGIWGLGQLGEKNQEAVNTLIGLLGDKESRVREQAAKTLSDLKIAAAAEKLVPLLKDSSSRVQAFAAIALGKLKFKPALPSLVELLRANDDKDAYLRHAGMMGLLGCGDSESLKPLIKSEYRAVRLATMLALRRMKDPQIAEFLKDADFGIYADTVRAIYEYRIMEAMPKLALELKGLFDREQTNTKMTELLFRRIIAANSRYGGPESAQLLADFAAKSNQSDDVRIFALDQLEKWEQPGDVDPVNGKYTPVPKRSAENLSELLKGSITQILDTGKDLLLAKAANIAGKYGVPMPEKLLWQSLESKNAVEALRLEALKQLVEKKSPQLLEIIPKLMKDANANIRSSALDALIQMDMTAGVALASDILAGKVQGADTITAVTEKTEEKWKTLSKGQPSADDYADVKSGHGVTVTYVNGYGKIIPKAGPEGNKLPRLNDGLAAENDDDVNNCTWLDGGESRMLMDLQKNIDVLRVNTFSWHKEERAPQLFTLWGWSAESKADPAAKDLAKAGWTVIANVDTTNHRNGGKHISYIVNGSSPLGNFRYLLWQSKKNGAGTFFTELDVYEKGQNVPNIETGSSDQKLKQTAIAALSKLTDPKAVAVFDGLLDQLTTNKLPENLQLDVYEAANARTEDTIKAKIAKFKEAMPKDDKLAPFRMTMKGGDVAAGKNYFEFGQAGCFKCHSVNTWGSANAGPNLGGVGKRLPLDKILESLIDPNAVIVPGYGTFSYKLNDGQLISGSLISENDKELVVKKADNAQVTIKKEDIKKSVPAVSPMPPMEKVLTLKEMRDVIAFLATQKQ